jgi:hypothetical protein
MTAALIAAGLLLVAGLGVYGVLRIGEAITEAETREDERDAA